MILEWRKIVTKKTIDVVNLSHIYENEVVLNDINFSVNEGEFVGIIGSNGSGKSTLIKLLVNLLPVQEGSITLCGKHVSELHKSNYIGFVSQKANSFNGGFPTTVGEVVLSGLAKKTGLFKMYTNSDKELCKSTLEKVGIADLINKNIGELSGGQQQRVFIARALISDPKLLILDEPTVGIDEHNVNEFYKLVASLDKTVVMVTHDVEVLTKYATKIMSLNKSVQFYGDVNAYVHSESRKLHKMSGCELEACV